MEMYKCIYENMSSLEPTNNSLSQFRSIYGSIHGYLSIVICVCGIVLNAANIVVLTRPNMVTSINVLLTWLAVADNLKMLDYLAFAVEFYILKKPNIDFMNTDNMHAAKYLLFHASFALICHNIAVWITVCLAMFRFLYIWFPAQGRNFSTVTLALVTVQKFRPFAGNHRDNTQSQGEPENRMFQESPFRRQNDHQQKITPER